MRATFTQAWRATCLGVSPGRATPRTRFAPRHTCIDPHHGVILATNARDATPWPPPHRLDGDNGQTYVEHGVRFWKAPELLAATRDLTYPKLILALAMVMTVCWLVYAAMEARIRQAIHGPDATYSNQPGKRVLNPSARRVFHDVVGVHLRLALGQWPIMLNRTDEPRHLRPLLGKPYMAFYGVKYS